MENIRSLHSYHHRFGTFLKTIPLPVNADTEKVKTEQKGDELVITMPKKT
ncbi:MAG TPA: Hsp20/alpha crystallin family protein [Candidatus Omnitrophota bacterium]|nr:Hsp20/alpha crystallin family protein [Candidatus Omnitrophota bacterium]